MADVVQVYTKDGYPLDELDVAVTRTWFGEDFGEAKFQIAVNDPKATGRNLRENNIVTVKSSYGVEDWVGVIWGDPPISVEYGVYTVSLKSAEFLLTQRVTDVYVSAAGDARTIFDALIVEAMKGEKLPIVNKVKWPDLPNRDLGYVWHLEPIYDAIQTLAKDGAFTWHFTPVTEGKRLFLQPVIRQKDVFFYHITYGRVLIQNSDLHHVTIERSSPELVTVLYVYGEPGNWKHLEPDIIENKKSRAAYGYIERSSPESGTDDRFLSPKASMYMRQNEHPHLTIRGVISEPPFPKFGDTLRVELVENNYIVREHGRMVTCRVADAAWAAEDNGMAVNLVEVA